MREWIVEMTYQHTYYWVVVWVIGIIRDTLDDSQEVDDEGVVDSHYREKISSGGTDCQELSTH